MHLRRGLGAFSGMVALAFTLSACNMSNIKIPSVLDPVVGAPATPDAGGLSGLIAQVQAQAVKACGFLPAVNTVSSLLGIFNGGQGLSSVISAADAICKSVTGREGARSSIRKGAVKGYYRGVPIQGKFVS